MIPKAPGFRLDGRRAVVTGAGRGIGLAAAAALAEAGAAVTLVARTAHEIAAAAAEIGQGVVAECLDVSDLAAVDAFFASRDAFDVLVNNTDRKGGHCLHDQVNDIIVGIDHGLTFHEDWKLRTVIWDFAGEKLPPAAADDVCRVVADLESGPLGERFAALLDADELDAVVQRAQVLLARGLPYPEDYHSTPWPLV